MQTLLILAIIAAAGLALGKIKVWGISLGITFVFFTGILAGHLGLRADRAMLAFAQNAGLVIFVYSLGMQVGPGFFSSFKKGGVKLNILGMAVVLTGFAMVVLISMIWGKPVTEMAGLFSGAVTNTPMLGAAQQAALQIHPGDSETVNTMSLACAVGYPIGVIGMIAVIIILRKAGGNKGGLSKPSAEPAKPFITEYQVSNPAIFGKTIRETTSLVSARFVISRVWRNGKVSIPASDTVIDKDDHLLVISGKHDVDAIRTLFGDQEKTDWNKKDIDWNSIDRQLVSRHVLVTKPNLNGVKLGSLRLRNSFGINITRVNRAGIDLLASPSLRLQLGDKLTIVGDTKAIDRVAEILGNQEKQLRNPNLFAIFVGLAVGLIIGSIPFSITGMSMPVRLGLAGGPIITGILMGAFGPRLHLSIYTTRSANLMLRQLGLIIYLAGLGLSAGKDFFETVFRTEGLIWIAVSFILATVPVLIVGWIATKWTKVDYASNVGMLCGSMANPIALDYANTTVEGDEPSVSYATVYPFSIFLRVISIQILMLIFY